METSKIIIESLNEDSDSESLQMTPFELMNTQCMTPQPRFFIKLIPT